MKTVKVVAAIIKKDNYVLTTQRGYGEFKGLWEFPGGKIEEKETKIEALIREIKEELLVDIKVNDFVLDVNYDYPDFHLEMSCYFCEIKQGELKLIEALSYKWLDKNSLDEVKWLKADQIIVDKLKEIL